MLTTLFNASLSIAYEPGSQAHSKKHIAIATTIDNVFFMEVYSFVEWFTINIVGAHCVRPWAVTDRPYIFFRKLFAKFKFPN